MIGRYLKALDSPVRVRMLEALDRCGELTVKEIGAAAGVSGDDASQHLAVLRREGMVARRKNGRQAFYRLADEAVMEIFERVSERLGSRSKPLEPD